MTLADAYETCTREGRALDDRASEVGAQRAESAAERMILNEKRAALEAHLAGLLRQQDASAADRATLLGGRSADAAERDANTRCANAATELEAARERASAATRRTTEMLARREERTRARDALEIGRAHV